jgi:broad specificity phosphatase PhoE
MAVAAKARLLRIAIWMAAGSLGLSAQSTVFVSRHAARHATEPDPALTEAGEKQAEALGLMLAAANVTRIYTTQLIRTRQTAAPAARRAKVEPVVVQQEEFDELIRRVRETLRPGESTLVVGHRGTVPRIVKALSGKDIPPLTASEYGRLLAVTLFPDGRSSVVTLRYAE